MDAKAIERQISKADWQIATLSLTSEGKAFVTGIRRALTWILSDLPDAPLVDERNNWSE